jgi:hypothetical protein
MSPDLNFAFSDSREQDAEKAISRKFRSLLFEKKNLSYPV